MSKATIYDVAGAARVSLATVSRAINNPEKVKEYRSGKEKLFGFFVGQIMKISKGKVNPQSVNEILTKKLNSN